MSLCFVKDRLYLVEREYEYESLHLVRHSRTTGTSDGDSHRILVLSLQGDILQVVTHPTEPTARFKSICCFDHKLLVGHYYGVKREVMWDTLRYLYGQYGILALQGL